MRIIARLVVAFVAAINLAGCAAINRYVPILVDFPAVANLTGVDAVVGTDGGHVFANEMFVANLSRDGWEDVIASGKLVIQLYPGQVLRDRRFSEFHYSDIPILIRRWDTNRNFVGFAVNKFYLNRAGGMYFGYKTFPQPQAWGVTDDQVIREDGSRLAQDRPTGRPPGLVFRKGKVPKQWFDGKIGVQIAFAGRGYLLGCGTRQKMQFLQNGDVFYIEDTWVYGYGVEREIRCNLYTPTRQFVRDFPPIRFYVPPDGNYSLQYVFGPRGLIY